MEMTEEINVLVEKMCKDKLRDLIREIIREELRFDTKTESLYTGGMDGGPLYRDSHYVEVLWENEVVTSFSIG